MEMKTVAQFKMVFGGKREYEKDNKKHYMYSLLMVDSEKNLMAHKTTTLF